MDEIRARLRKSLENHWETPVELLVEDILQWLTPHLKGPKIPVIEPGALRAWIDGTLDQYTKKQQNARRD